jgi:hypothetical protein
MQVKWKWCSELNRDNLKHKFYIARNLWEEAPLPSPIVYFVPFHKDYIQMSLFPGTPKWVFYCPKILDAHIFLKSSLFWECKDNIL